MMEFARYLIPFCTTVLWVGLLAPLILRGFGTPMAIGFWRLDRLNRHLSKRQYLWGYGVFSFGVGYSSVRRCWIIWTGEERGAESLRSLPGTLPSDFLFG